MELIKKAQKLAHCVLQNFFEMGGLSEQTLISVPNVGPGEDHCMPFFDACKVLGKNPERWLSYVLKNIKTTPKDKLYTLLPEFWEDEG